MSAKPQKKKVLHIGCGPREKSFPLPPVFGKDEWEEIRFDINPDVKPDIVGDMRDMHMVETGSMDGIFSSHNLEHLYVHEVATALKEFNRVLREGGQAIVGVPDMQITAAYIADGVLDEPLYESPAGPIAPLDMVFGWSQSIAKGNHFMAHKTAFTAGSLAKKLKEAGFSDIRLQREWVNLWAAARKLPAELSEKFSKVQLNNKTLFGPKGQGLPRWIYARLMLEQNPETKLDALEEPPALWKPIGLKKP